MTSLTSRRKLAAASAAALFLVAALGGCLGRGEPGGDWTADAPEREAAAGSSTKGWQDANWWGYKATFEGDVTIDVALIVFETHEDHFRLGSNLSAGFFGLPFNGNVTRPDLNPVVAGEEWRLYDFPLEGGKSWTYPFLGYDLTATVTAATIEAPGVGEHEGFVLEATSFGRTVARYTYSPEVEWFTQLVIYEPTDGHEVVRVELTELGEDFADDYFVTVPVHAYSADYPSVPDPDRFSVEGSFLKLTASIVLTGKVGDFRFRLDDPTGRTAWEGELRPSGVLIDRETIDAKPGAWRLEHLGVGQGALRLEVTGVQAARQGELVPPSGDAAARLDVEVPRIEWGATTALATAPPAAEDPEPSPLDIGVIEGALAR